MDAKSYNRSVYQQAGLWTVLLTSGGGGEIIAFNELSALLAEKLESADFCHCSFAVIARMASRRRGLQPGSFCISSRCRSVRLISGV